MIRANKTHSMDFGFELCTLAFYIYLNAFVSCTTIFAHIERPKLSANIMHMSVVIRRGERAQMKLCRDTRCSLEGTRRVGELLVVARRVSG